ncbi:Argininosuccinate lyase [Pseudobythopirellula maris]|uniref:Argininosuccinate lyase n=1 Tax=Pseudobythopirellula maris TaxID=2527991 RepID=A0A5C5ZS96_9BACT|nr:argininosuccinate lyase [Pseudobythopirellula maris]TWT89073.1 Argininosuccinate lyase [Pseudobythopirellula maris]
MADPSTADSALSGPENPRASASASQSVSSNATWGGVFDGATDKRVERFSESVSYDRRLFEHDIRGSVAHSRMLASVGVLTSDEQSQIEAGLTMIGLEIQAGQFEFRQELEDVHMNIERALIDKIGDVGRKLHTGRSRNDQVSTDFRMWVRTEIDRLDGLLKDVQRAFVGRCATDEGVVLPGYTHLQRAQPVLAAHYWLAYCEKLERDRGRLADCRRRVNQLPLGTAALAGTTIPIDRQMVADDLGFEGLVANSLDSSSDRDFALEFCSCLSVIAVHLSGWAEEWVLWSTTEFGFLKPPQAFCTGSSIMPQKINPDVLELIRGKSARVIGSLQSLLVLTKGLPLAYNRDLQEDKERVFDAADTVTACLELAAPLVAGAELRRESIASRLDHGYLDATTLMEHLIKLGVPQRTAHETIGKLVGVAMQRGVRLADLEVQEFTSACDKLDESVYEVLGVDRAIEAFRSVGSTHPDRVAEQEAVWRERLS